jgi:beta-glucuronidase
LALAVTLGGLILPATARAAHAAIVTPPYGFPYEALNPYTATPPTSGALASDGQTGRYLLGGTWLYEADPNNIGLAAGWQRQTATAGWQEVAVPNAYNAGDLSQGSMAGYVGWYRRDFTLPGRAFPASVPRIAQSWMVEFESVNYSATVWCNGHELGTHTGAYLPFEFPLRYLHAGANHLVIRVDDRRTPTSFPPGPGGGWWNFGGILDAVYLLPVARADLDTVTIVPALRCPTCAATVTVRAVIRNLSPRPQTVALRGSYGPIPVAFGEATIRPGGTWIPTAVLTVRRPQLWAPGHPHLYHVSLTLTDGRGHTLGGYSYLSGIRRITVTSAGILELNGRPLHLRGVNLHEQTVSSGAALSVPQMAQLLTWAQQLHATIIRAHYPLDPELEQMADERGILLWSEVPVYQTQDAALREPGVRAAAVKLLEANIVANGNHPSILLWSIGNELPTPPTAAETAYIAAAAAAARALDPTRPVTMAISDWPGVGCQTAYAPLGVIGVNEYFGWFDAGGGSTDDRQELGPFLQSLRACYPHQALFVSEFGYGGDRNGPVEARGTYAYQQDMLSYSLGVFNGLDWLAGAIWFPMQDFAAAPNFDGSDPLGQPPYVDKGVLDRYGNPKPAFATMAAGYGAVAPY